MKVFANIDDQAIVIEDFLPEDLFKKEIFKNDN